MTRTMAMHHQITTDHIQAFVEPVKAHMFRTIGVRDDVFQLVGVIRPVQGATGKIDNVLPRPDFCFCRLCSPSR